MFVEAMFVELFYPTILTMNNPQGENLITNITGKGENAGNQHFTIFPQHFLTYHR